MQKLNHSIFVLMLGSTFVSGAAELATQQKGAMHVPMRELPRVIVTQTEGGAFSGKDNRVLQAAVDYVASLGGGVVEIGPGEFTMRDSLHLRPNITVIGTAKTVLRKARAAVSKLKLDGDFGEEQITVASPDGFQVGDGVAIWDKNANGFHTTVARITGATVETFAINLPLNADCMIENDAQAATVFPVISGYFVEGVKVDGLVIDGNKQENPPLNGCRGGGIFLYRCPGAVLANCTVRNYNGDGISFQQSNDVTVSNCVSEANTGLGLHPGSGSQRPTVRNCVARNNGEDGLFLCWRVKRGLFEDNLFEGNGRFGISIGHKDTDNLLRNNRVRQNAEDGIFFREETEGMAGHRNRLENNLIEDNGREHAVAGIRVRGETRDLLFKGNVIRDTRSAAERKQNTGVLLEPKVGPVALEQNQIEAAEAVADKRATK